MACRCMLESQAGWPAYLGTACAAHQMPLQLITESVP
jgi:hypothetical protein